MLPFLRKYRTILLALIATALLVWSAVYIFDLPWSDMLEILLASVMGVVIIIFAALVVSLLLRLWRRR